MTGGPAPGQDGLDPRLRGLLVCPSCRGELEEIPSALRCPAERLRWPVVDGVPLLVPEEARREHA